MASTFVAGGDLEYGRYANPTWTALEDTLGALEGGRCLTFASGMAAVTTVLDLVGNGAKVVAPRHSYSGTILQLADLEARGRIKAELVDITDTDAVVKACDDAALVWLESPTNPALELADIETITAAAHEAGAYVAVDNTFATPLLQTPLAQGVDLVVHSATKYLAGHSDVLLGAICTRDDELFGVLKNRRDLMGAIPGTFEAWLVLRGMRTLHLRVERAQANAQELVRRLRGPPGDRRGPLPRLRRDRLDRARAGCDRRRPAHPQDPVVGARHVARRGRVDARAPSPLEGRGPDHPRGPGPALRRHRGRRGPLGRPADGARRLRGEPCAFGSPLIVAAAAPDAVETAHRRSAADGVSLSGASHRREPRASSACLGRVACPSPRAARSELARRRLSARARRAQSSQPWCRAR